MSAIKKARGFPRLGIRTFYSIIVNWGIGDVTDSPLWHSARFGSGDGLSDVRNIPAVLPLKTPHVRLLPASCFQAAARPCRSSQMHIILRCCRLVPFVSLSFAMVYSG